MQARASTREIPYKGKSSCYICVDVCSVFICSCVVSSVLFLNVVLEAFHVSFLSNIFIYDCSIVNAKASIDYAKMYKHKTSSSPSLDRE